MATTIGTATKKTKGADIYPPREQFEPKYDGQDRARAASRKVWLAAKVAELNATGKHVAKIVGVGSYQHVSVWDLVTVEGRQRHRGVCQFCGHSQVITGASIVLHGYNRPGFGYIIGKCPEVGSAPLNVEDSRTRFWLADFEGKLPAAVAAEVEADRLFAIAKAVAEQSGENRYSASNERPHLHSKPTDTERAAFEAKVAAWAAKYPRHNELANAAARSSDARNKRAWIADMITHLSGLLSSGILGTPLEVEVVA